MQDLLRKKNDLVKKKKTLLSTFFVNLVIIIMLISNSLPFINIYLKVFLVGSLSMLEGFISKELKYTRKDIKKINIKINCIKELEYIDKNENVLEKTEDIEINIDECVLNNEIKENNNIKVKKKTL